MRGGYFAEQGELIEDLEKYEVKVDQFYEGLQLMHDEPMKAFMMMGDAFRYFQEFNENHNKDGKNDRGFDTKNFKNYFKGDVFRGNFNGFDSGFGSRYKSNRKKRSSEKNEDEGSTVTWYSFGPDLEPLNLDDIIDAAMLRRGETSAVLVLLSLPMLRTRKTSTISWIMIWI